MEKLVEINQRCSLIQRGAFTISALGSIRMTLSKIVHTLKAILVTFPSFQRKISSEVLREMFSLHSKQSLESPSF